MAKVAKNLDPVSHVREQAAVRQRENDNRHREDVIELKDVHKAELDRERSAAQKLVQNIQDECNVKLNQRDLQHQKEIESLKAIYSKRLSENKKS